MGVSYVGGEGGGVWGWEIVSFVLGSGMRRRHVNLGPHSAEHGGEGREGPFRDWGPGAREWHCFVAEEEGGDATVR